MGVKVQFLPGGRDLIGIISTDEAGISNFP